MRVAVYPGSFNPLHIGHLSIVRHLTERAGFDIVYLIVSPKNPFKANISEDSGRARYNAVIQAVARYPELKVKVDDIELNLPAPQYTIRTLNLLKEREPQNTFKLVIGGDNLENVNKWREGERILTEYGVVVYPRTGFDSQALKAALTRENSLYDIELIDAPVIEVSSTQIREAMAAGRDVSDLLAITAATNKAQNIPTEIERKFLVKSDDYKHLAERCVHIVQGYVCRESGRTVRVRIAEGHAWLTIKGRSTDNGLSRSEWEYEIPAEDAYQMLRLCDGGIIDKHRYLVPVAPCRHWEVDEFHGAHEGLVVAEVELNDENEVFPRPDWLGEEVTGDRRYYNSVLSATNSPLQ